MRRCFDRLEEVIRRPRTFTFAIVAGAAVLGAGSFTQLGAAGGPNADAMTGLRMVSTADQQPYEPEPGFSDQARREAIAIHEQDVKDSGPVRYESLAVDTGGRPHGIMSTPSEVTVIVPWSGSRDAVPIDASGDPATAGKTVTYITVGPTIFLPGGPPPAYDSTRDLSQTAGE